MWRLLYSTLRQPQHRRQAAAISALTGASAISVSNTSPFPFGQIGSAGNITFCDDANNQGGPKPPPNLTFRKRRLSIASPQDGSDGEDEGRDATAEKSQSTVSHDDASSEATIMRTSYAIEIEGSAKTTSNSINHKKKMFADFLADLGIKGVYEYDHDEEDEDDVAVTSSDLQHHHHTTYAKPSLSSPKDQRDKPFTDEKVGAFSAHGIEPHPYIVKEEAVSFFSSQLEPQVVTLVTQKINQDRGIVAYPFGDCPKTAMFGVFDGHGMRGELVAEYAMNEIAKRLHRHSKFNSNLEAAFAQTYLRVDHDIERRYDVEPYHSGTTACVAVLRDDALSVSNVGDSRAVIGRRRRGRDKPYALPGGPTIPGHTRYECIELTKDQNAADPAERKRIVRSGGYVGTPLEPGLPTRIYLDKECTMVGLAMSRSIGDWNMKKVGVIAEPVVTHHTVTDRDEFLIVASDGIWEFIDSADAVRIVGDCLDRGCTASEASIQLIRRAMKTWRDHEGDYRDDCTAIVVRLPGLWNE